MNKTITIRSTWHAGAGVEAKLEELGFTITRNSFRDNDGLYGNSNLELPKKVVDKYFVYKKGNPACSGFLSLRNPEA